MDAAHVYVSEGVFFRVVVRGRFASMATTGDKTPEDVYDIENHENLPGKSLKRKSPPGPGQENDGLAQRCFGKSYRLY